MVTYGWPGWAQCWLLPCQLGLETVIFKQIQRVAGTTGSYSESVTCLYMWNIHYCSLFGRFFFGIKVTWWWKTSCFITKVCRSFIICGPCFNVAHFACGNGSYNCLIESQSVTDWVHVIINHDELVVVPQKNLPLILILKCFCSATVD